jgi:insulysin
MPPSHRHPPIQILSSNVEKPQVDDRSYRLIKLLGNDLEALLVHDPKTEKAAAAMDVHVGHMSDPKEFPGLAHALEHCLFMGIAPPFPVPPVSALLTSQPGTKRYPQENDYQKSNAFTGLSH